MGPFAHRHSGDAPTGAAGATGAQAAMPHHRYGVQGPNAMPQFPHGPVPGWYHYPQQIMPGMIPAAPSGVVPPHGYWQPVPPSYPSEVPPQIHMQPPVHVQHGYFNSWEQQMPPPPPPPPQPPMVAPFAPERSDKSQIIDRQHDNPAYPYVPGHPNEGPDHVMPNAWQPRPPHAAGLNPLAHPFYANGSINPGVGPPNPPRATLSPGMNATLVPGIITPQQGPFLPLDLHPPDQHHQAGENYSASFSSRLFQVEDPKIPADIEAELQGLLDNLNGTKESIKGAKTWFMQWAASFAPGLAKAFCDRITAIDDVERQLYIIYVTNDILLNSLQHRSSTDVLDNEALAFLPFLGSILSAVYHNPHSDELHRERVKQILQFWGKMGVYESDSISILEKEMTVPTSQPSKTDETSISSSLQVPEVSQPEKRWGCAEQQDKKHEQPQHEDLPGLPSYGGSFESSHGLASDSHVPITAYRHASSPRIIPSAPESVAQAVALTTNPPPYPLFPPGLIPGMVRKAQVGSGVPYSAISPLDIPTVVPPSTLTEDYILGRVANFFREIGELDPLDERKGGRATEVIGRDDDINRKFGACIPPPSFLQDATSGDYEIPKVGLGAGASLTEGNDAYSSYRKQSHFVSSAKAAVK